MESHPVIALVENDLPSNRAFARLLRAYGFTVDAFTSAEMLLDIDLDGMSGLQLQQVLAQRASAVPVIFVTGRSDAGARNQAQAQGCSSFLYKPVKGQVLAEAITAAIAAARGARHNTTIQGE